MVDNGQDARSYPRSECAYVPDDQLSWTRSITSEAAADSVQSMTAESARGHCYWSTWLRQRS